jgi:hypothetical protein
MENLPLLKQIIATGNQTNKKLDELIESLAIVRDAADYAIKANEVIFESLDIIKNTTDDVRQTAEEIEKEIEKS